MKDKYSGLPDEIKNPPMFYDPDGNPCSLRTWTRLFEEFDRQLALTEIERPDGTKTLVSTIWMGISRTFIDGVPNIFETAILSPTQVLYESKSCTRTQALAEHDQMVAFARNIARVTKSGHDLGCLGNHQGDCAVSGMFS